MLYLVFAFKLHYKHKFVWFGYFCPHTFSPIFKERLHLLWMSLSLCYLEPLLKTTTTKTKPHCTTHFFPKCGCECVWMAFRLSMLYMSSQCLLEKALAATCNHSANVTFPQFTFTPYKTIHTPLSPMCKQEPLNLVGGPCSFFSLLPPRDIKAHPMWS